MTRPPFSINSKILLLTASIQEIVGELKSISTKAPSVKLRRENKIRSIHCSLAIEGNALTKEQITAILENKRVLGPKNQIKEVQNALDVYDRPLAFDPTKERDLLRAHGLLMQDLIVDPGKYRKTSVGIFKGTQVSHVAPQARKVPILMADLFDFLRRDEETPWLIKACVFHYELEFIHPFVDGNGRMGRLWQQLILMKQSPVFEFTSAESLVHKRQQEYYRILEKCDKLGDSTSFIEFSLETIFAALKDLNKTYRPARLLGSDRILVALDQFGEKEFSRKDYLSLHKGLSTASGSRDLQRACQNGLLKKIGDKVKARYRKG
jgi:Fic family protein